MFKETNRTLEEYKRNIHQSYLATFLVIHDEFDFLVDRFLLEPLSAKVADLLEQREIFNRLGYKFVRFKFDIEYDDDGSFVPSKTLNAIEYNLRKYKRLSDKDFGFTPDSKSPSRPEETTIKSNEPITQPTKTITVILTSIEYKYLESVLTSMGKLTGNDSILIEYNGQIFENPSLKVNSSLIEKYCNKINVPYLIK